MHNRSGVQFGKRRGETWSYRREVPSDVRARVGVREWSKGLGRISKSAARIASNQASSSSGSRQGENAPTTSFSAPPDDASTGLPYWNISTTGRP